MKAVASMVAEEEKEVKVQASINPLGLSQLLMQVYGPYAFGVTSLLLIWFSIVKPELNARNISWESHATVLKTQQEIVTTMQTTARNMQTTATIMERTVNKIDDWSGK